IARSQLAKLPDIIDRRKRLARRYLEIFDGIDPRLHLVDPGDHIPSVMPLVAPNGALRDRVASALHARGVGTRRGDYPTLDRQRVLDGVALRANTGDTAFANSAWWQDHLLCLPFHLELTERDIRTIRECIHSAVHL